ncbi:AraC family transcriptional regulator [Shinella sp. HZN7]|uniref:AraC family transcriptional regulator n=1 Tax=Shinella sp. (strain HZN7) TaxID=879274 RepID=UPI000A5B1EBD|nr:AraC family transcriptional regulator [Shinella sp. HZN7]
MMQQRIEEGRPISVGLLLLPQFSMMALASASEPLRAANRLSGRKLYDWCLLSQEGGEISSSSGFETRTVSIDDAPHLDRLFVVASLDIESKRPKPILQFLRRQAVSGKPVGALSTGTFLLARAGLLAGKRCTLHWESLPQFAEEFPEIEVTRELYVRDDNRWTCAGGTAAIDLMLAQISGDYGAKLAADTAEQFLHTRIRGLKNISGWRSSGAMASTTPDLPRRSPSWSRISNTSFRSMRLPREAAFPSANWNASGISISR